jgi:hypothetical protein
LESSRARRGSAMEDIRFDRSFRTPYSEGYQLMRGTKRLGTVDLHFTPPTVRCTLVVEQELSKSELARLIEQIDEDLVLSAEVPRDDFLVNAYTGREIGFFSDDFHADDEGVELDIDRRGKNRG